MEINLWRYKIALIENCIFGGGSHSISFTTKSPPPPLLKHINLKSRTRGRGVHRHPGTLWPPTPMLSALSPFQLPNLSFSLPFPSFSIHLEIENFWQGEVDLFHLPWKNFIYMYISLYWYICTYTTGASYGTRYLIGKTTYLLMISCQLNGNQGMLNSLNWYMYQPFYCYYICQSSMSSVSHPCLRLSPVLGFDSKEPGWEEYLC